jgi:ParB-like chromosome segregation protein Spo0J
MKTVTLPLDKLIAYAGNPRKNDHAVEAVAAAIKRFGFRVPVLAKSDGSLIDGHLRVKAAKHLGMEEVPAVLCDDLSEADIKALRISINRMAELAEWDTELLSAELEGLTEQGVALDVTGFDADSLSRLGLGSLDLDIADGFSDTRADSEGLADLMFSIGEYRFPVEREAYLQWKEKLRQEVGFNNAAIHEELKRRLQL